MENIFKNKQQLSGKVLTNEFNAESASLLKNIVLGKKVLYQFLEWELRDL